MNKCIWILNLARQFRWQCCIRVVDTAKYCKAFNMMHPIPKLKCFSACLAAVCPIGWSQVLSQKWRCSWSSANRGCSNYIWLIIIFIAYKGAPYIRSLRVIVPSFIDHIQILWLEIENKLRGLSVSNQTTFIVKNDNNLWNWYSFKHCNLIT